MMPPSCNASVIFRLAAMLTLMLAGGRTSSAAIRGPTTMTEKAEKTDDASSMLGRRLFLDSSFIAHQPRPFDSNEPAAEPPEQRPFDYYDAAQEEDRQQQQALVGQQQLQQLLELQLQQQKQQLQQQRQFVVDGETAANDRLILIRRPIIVAEPAFPTAAGRRSFLAAVLRPVAQQRQQQQPEENVVFIIDNDSAAETESRPMNAGEAPSSQAGGSGWKLGAEKTETATPKVSIIEDSAREEVDDDASRNSKEEEPKTDEQEGSSKTIVGDSATEMPEVNPPTVLSETEAPVTSAPEEVGKIAITEAPETSPSDTEATEVTAGEAKTDARTMETSTASKNAEIPQNGRADTEVPEADTSADRSPETVTARMVNISSAESSSPSSAIVAKAATASVPPRVVSVGDDEASSEGAAKATASFADLPVPPASPRFVQRLAAN